MVWPDARPAVAQMKQIHSGKTVLSMTNLQRKCILTYYTPPDEAIKTGWVAAMDLFLLTRPQAELAQHLA